MFWPLDNAGRYAILDESPQLSGARKQDAKMAKDKNGKNGKNGKSAIVSTPKVEQEQKQMTTDQTVQDQEQEQETAEAREPQGVQKIAVTDLDAAIAGLVTDGHVGANMPELVKSGLVKAYVDFVQVAKNAYYGQYVRFTIGDNATEEEQVGEAILAICGGAVINEDKDKVSLVKAALYGADLFARNRTSQRVRSAIGADPAKAFEKMVKQIMDAKPSWTREKAEARAKLMLDEGDDE